MQSLIPVVCFVAGFALAWVVLRRRAGDFQKLSAGALQDNSQAIGEMLKPVAASLEKVDARIRELEVARQGAYAELATQVRALLETGNALRGETGKLVTALRTPGVRGRWGEVQLRRVVEMAGMVEYCDFLSQPGAVTEEGRLRPDLVVRLPSGKSIVVDAKTPLEAFLRAIEAPDDDTRRLRLAEHARQVRAHVDALSRKSYWQQFDPTPEFAVLFLPGESFFSAALEQDPELIEYGAGQNIILATPTTLIALLRAVSYGWRQEDLARNAREISRLGAELYGRIDTMRDHWQKMGRSLEAAVDAYNKAVGSLESRVLPGARKFVELRAASGEPMDELAPIEKAPRHLSAGGAAE
jgi:DNA recombination protein RmuC